MIITVCHEGGQTDGRMEGQTDGRKDSRTDGQRDTNSYRVALRILKSSFHFSKTTSSPVVTVINLPMASDTDIPIGQSCMVIVDNAFCFFYERYYAMYI